VSKPHLQEASGAIYESSKHGRYKERVIEREIDKDTHERVAYFELHVLSFGDFVYQSSKRGRYKERE